jgi:hypothetical protein
LARNHAKGVPKSNANNVAMTDVRSDNVSAVRAVSFEIADQKFDHDVRHTTAATGTIKSAAAGRPTNAKPRGWERRRVMAT